MHGHTSAVGGNICGEYSLILLNNSAPFVRNIEFEF